MDDSINNDGSTPDHVYGGDVLRSKNIDYDDDDIVDEDIVSDDQVDNSIAGGNDQPSSTPTLTEEDFDDITTDNSREL